MVTLRSEHTDAEKRLRSVEQRLQLFTLDNQEGEELEEINDDDDREVRDAKEQWYRCRDEAAHAKRRCEAILGEIVLWSVGEPGLDGDDISTPEVVKARRIIKPFKPKGKLSPHKQYEYDVRQMLRRKGLLIERRTLQDYYQNLDVPEALHQAIKENNGIHGKRLRGDSGESGLKVLKQFPIHSFKDIQRAVVAAARLQHPGVVPIECAFIDARSIYVQSRFYTGGNLRQWATGKSAEVRLLAASHIVSVVAFLHDNQILHRDLKPENIVMDGNDDCAPPALCDFDLSLDISQTQQTTKERGTMLYMPLDGTPPSEKGDVYSLGVTLFDLLVCE